MSEIEIIPAQYLVDDLVFNTESEAKQYLYRKKCRAETIKILEGKASSSKEGELKLYSLVYGDYDSNERDLGLLTKKELLKAFTQDEDYYTMINEPLMVSEETYKLLNGELK